MADNPTSAQILAGNSAGPGQTASGQPQTYDAQQTAILQANQQRQLAEQRAAEAAHRAAIHRPGGENDIGNTDPIPGLKVQYTSLPPTSGSNVKARGGRKGK